MSQEVRRTMGQSFIQDFNANRGVCGFVSSAGLITGLFVTEKQVVIRFTYYPTINWGKLLWRHRGRWCYTSWMKKRNHQHREPLIESLASHSEIALSMITQRSMNTGQLGSGIK